MYDVNWEVLIVIGRTARLARPIRSHVLVEGMHVYVTRNEKLRYFIPTYWLRKLASLQHYRIKRGRNIKDLNHASERALVGSAVTTPGNMFSIDDSQYCLCLSLELVNFHGVDSFFDYINIMF